MPAACIATLALSIYAIGHTHAQLIARTEFLGSSLAAQMPVPLLRRLALNQPQAIADLYYLRAISSFGDKSQHSAHYPLVQPLLWRASMLDPQFVSPYLLSGQAAAILGFDTERALELLARGRRARPDAWRIPFYEGFIAYYWRHDDARAAEALGAAAQDPRAPPQLLTLASTLSASAARPEVGLMLLEEMLRQPLDEQRRAQLTERRDKLMLEVVLLELGAAQKEFVARFGRKLLRLDELVEAHLVARIPADPLGGRLYVDNAGHVRSIHEAERLRLSDDARARPSSPSQGAP